MKHIVGPMAALAMLAAIGLTSPRRALAMKTGGVFTVKVKLKTPKNGKDKRVARPLDEVSMSMYVSPCAKVVRGAVLNPFYEETVKQEHWRTATGLWDFALIGTNLFRVRNDELGLTIRQGLKQLAEASGCPEVARTPLCLVGMSIGAGLSTRIVEAMPEQVIAAGPVCLEVGPRDDASGRVPMITIFGERDGRQMEILARKLSQARAQHAQWATAIQWRLRHDFARANNLLMPLFDRAIRHRRTKGATPQAEPVKLRDYREADGWLGDPNTWAGGTPRIAPAKGFRGNAAKACWLPDAYAASVWQAFVVREPKLAILEPTGMGDGKPFSAHRAGKAVRVRVQVVDGLNPRRLELYDGDRKLADFEEGKREAAIRGLTSGVHSLIAAATDPAGEKHLSRPNTILVVAADKAGSPGPLGAKGAKGRDAAGPGAAPEFAIRVSSFLGGEGDEDGVNGAAIQSDGTIALAANLGKGALAKWKTDTVRGQEAQAGCLLRLTLDGRRVLSILRLAADVRDLAVDGKDNLYVAAGASGVMKVHASGDRLVWSQPLGAPCDRVDAAGDGSCVALAGKTVSMLSPDGQVLGTAPGRGFTTDVCIDGQSRTVVIIGFRNARAHDGRRTNPVQICYVRAVGYDGKGKWIAYDWSTDRNSDRFLNKPTNNMADTRAYRCEVGRDGKLYVGFEAAGGNHIFRYSPVDIMEKVAIVGGDRFHQFYNSGADHKTIVGRFEPGTGRLLSVQQFCARTARGRTGNVRMKRSALTADEEGRLYLAGWADADLPISPDPCAAGEPKGGPFLWGMSSDLKKRLICTRMQAVGWAHCAAARRVNGRLMVVYGGSGAEKGMYTSNALQLRAVSKDGFFVLLEMTKRPQ